MTSRTLVAVVLAALLGSTVGALMTGLGADAEAAMLDVPSGAVIAFDALTCPAGWSPYAPAKGRTIVGLRPGGALGGVSGDRLDDLETPAHQHRLNIPEFQAAAVPAHHHVSWRYSNGTWETGSGSELVAWGDGVGNEGSGYYPPAFSSKYEGGTRILYTDDSASHGHDIDPPKRKTNWEEAALPYVQLKYCEKD